MTSKLLFEWTTAIIEINKNDIKRLLQREPELLWTPIPHTLDDFESLRKKLVDIQRLGSSFQPVCAIQFMCLLYHAFESDNADCYQLVTYLVDQSSLHDLNTRYWGDCNNLTAHLVCFLENQPILRLLIEKGVSTTIANDLGYTPKDSSTCPTFLNDLSRLQQQTVIRRPNYSTPDRFKLLKERAEEPTDNKPPDRLKHEGKFFRAGLVNESKQKVLLAEDQVVIEDKSKREKEVAQLVKKLVVKSNPLFQKYEKRTLYTAPSRRKLDTSFFEQQVVEGKPASNKKESILEDSTNTSETIEEGTVQTNAETDEEITAESSTVDSNTDITAETNTEISIEDIAESMRESASENLTEDTLENMTVNSDKKENEDELQQQQQRKARLRSSILVVPKEHVVKEQNTLRDSIRMTPQEEERDDILESSDESLDEEEDSIPVQIATRVPINHFMIPARDSGIDIQPHEDHARRRSGSQKASWTMSMSSWAAILDREFNLSEQQKEEMVEEKAEIKEEKMLDDTMMSSTTLVPDKTLIETKHERRRGVYTHHASTMTLTTPVSSQKGYGKLYLHIHGIERVHLPRPRTRTYVRCVVSDGRYEYMSRYEVLEDTISFNHECIIDTYPDMIITLSIHVRPDYLMKPRIPFAQLFSKKKKSLSRYVSREDGALGQARFAVEHMLPVCTEYSYPAGFHCFNAWYKRSLNKRLRMKKQDKDVLKLVGHFDVEMLYLPTTEGQTLPQSLQEYNDLVNQYHDSADTVVSGKYSTF